MRVSSVDVHKDRNQLLVDSLMARMHAHPVGQRMQKLPTSPVIPEVPIRMLRGKLNIEETFELLAGLGIGITVGGEVLDPKSFTYVEVGKPSLIEVYDACCDIEVVTKGCASAFGTALQPGFEHTCGNNLLKFAPGHSFNDSGKLVKPPNHPRSDLAAILLAQGAEASDLVLP